MLFVDKTIQALIDGKKPAGLAYATFACKYFPLGEPYSKMDLEESAKLWARI